MNSRPEGLVVGYDGSDHAGLAVDWAAAEAHRRGCPLTVLSVTSHGLWQGDNTWAPGLLDAIQSVAREQAAQGMQRALTIAPDLKVSAMTKVEGVSSALIDASRDAELTVVGNRGRGELMGAALGSVAFAVSAHAHSPVVVVRGQDPRPPDQHASIVVGVDGSESSDAAVAFASDAAAGTGAHLVVIAAYRPASTQIWSGTALPALADVPAQAGSSLEAGGGVTFEMVVREAAERTAVAASVLAAGRHPGLRLSERVAEGSPVDILREASQEAGLLVVGSRGRGAFASLTLGSVSHGVIHGAGCPVAVIRPHS